MKIERTSPKKIFTNFLALSYGELIARLLGLIATVYLARVLGAQGFGKVSFAFSIVSYFAYIAGSWGFDKYGVREVAKNKHEVKRYVESIVTTRFLVAVITYVLLGAFVYLIPIPAITKKITLSYGLMLFTLPFGLAWVFAGMERMNVIAIGTIAKQAVFCGCILFLVRGKDQILIVPLSHVAGEIAGVVLWTCFFCREFRIYRLKVDIPFTKKVIAESVPFGVSNVTNVIFQNMGIVMLGFLRGEQIVGWYSGAHKIVTLILTFSKFYHVSLFPAISRAGKYNVQQMSFLVDKSVRFAIILSLPIGFGGTILAGEIVKLIFGGEFYGSVSGLKLLIWTVSLSLISGNYVNALLALDRVKEIMKVLLYATVVHIVFNFSLIPMFGLMGAASAAVISEAVILVSALIYVHRIGVKSSFVAHMAKPLIACLGMIGLLKLLPRMNFATSLTLGTISYFLVLISLKGITFHEIRSIYRETLSS